MYYCTILFIFLVYHKATLFVVCPITFTTFLIPILKSQTHAYVTYYCTILFIFLVYHKATPIPSLRNYVNKKVGDRKTKPIKYFISFKS